MIRKAFYGVISSFVAFTIASAVPRVAILKPFILAADKPVYHMRLGDNCHVAIDFYNFSDRAIKYAMLNSPRPRADRVAELSLNLYRDGARIQPIWLSCGDGIKKSTPLLNLQRGGRARSWFNIAVIYHRRLTPGVYDIRAKYEMDGYRDMGFTQLAVPEQTVAELIVKD